MTKKESTKNSLNNENAKKKTDKRNDKQKRCKSKTNNTLNKNDDFNLSNIEDANLISRKNDKKTSIPATISIAISTLNIVTTSNISQKFYETLTSNPKPITTLILTPEIKNKKKYRKKKQDNLIDKFN